MSNASSIPPLLPPLSDEERDILGATRTKLATDDPAFEVVVVDDRSSDGTRALLATLQTDPRLHVVDGVEPPDGVLSWGTLGTRATRVMGAKSFCGS